MRLVHTADIHLDACFAGSGMPPGFGNRRRQSLRDVFHGIVKRAAEWPADALLIAGDLFDLDRVGRDTVAFLQAEFDAVRPLPVLIAPGNHDPYVSYSPYATAAWSSNVMIFKTPSWKTYTINAHNLMVHGFAFDGQDISVNPFGSLQVAPRRGWVQTGLAHGSEVSHQPSEKTAYAPFQAADTAANGLDYLALGHFHSVTPIKGRFSTVMYYSGAPEGHSFNETGMKHYIEVEIEGSDVRVTPVPSSRVVYQTYTLNCSRFTHAQQIVDAVRAIAAAAPEPLVARVTLKGDCGPDLSIDPNALEDSLGQEFEALCIVDETEPAEDLLELERESTCLGVFIRKMNEEIADASDEQRRAFVKRARELGFAAYRQRDLPIPGLEED